MGGIFIFMRKILIVVFLILSSCSDLFADIGPDEYFEGEYHVKNPEPSINKRDKAGNPIELETADGLKIIYMGTFRTQKNDADQAGSSSNDNIFSVFMIKSNKDTEIKLDIREGVDTKINKFRWLEGSDWGYIADLGINSTPQEILGDIWMRVTFWHTYPRKFGEKKLIGRIGFVINDAELQYKKIHLKTWEDWQEIEKQVIKLEEDLEDEEQEINKNNSSDDNKAN